MTHAKHISPVVAIDIGNVCLHLDQEQCDREAGVANFWGRVVENRGIFEGELNAERGLCHLPCLLTECSKALEMPRERIEAAWFGFLGREIAGMAEFVDEMRHLGLRPVFFSNISWPHWRAAARKISFTSRMHGAILSCEALAIKPDPGIYEAMERRYCHGGIPCFYMDDLQANVEGGRRHGWASHLFTDVPNARQEFHRLLDEGLIPAHRR